MIAMSARIVKPPLDLPRPLVTPRISPSAHYTWYRSAYEALTATPTVTAKSGPFLFGQLVQLKRRSGAGIRISGARGLSQDGAQLF